MMKKQENFNDLIASIQEAFIQANKIDPWSVIFGLLILLDVAAAFIKKRSHKMF